MAVVVEPVLPSTVETPVPNTPAAVADLPPLTAKRSRPQGQEPCLCVLVALGVLGEGLDFLARPDFI
ncbi:hypothetical protein [Rhodococcus marinonascens]|uniref:hypothetical protein n=1 Tax=Rhodococcus marinonascens TaxID=38311 RepID=UPI0009328743|nr:hypothetical protein [Rhodococcus marinonascens]